MYRPPTTREELLARYACGERYFAWMELPENTDLSGVTLEGAIFDNGMLSDITFHHANLRNTSFRSANVKCADFRYSTLVNANFAGASIEAIDLYQAHIEGAHFQSATYYGITVDRENQKDIIKDLQENPYY